MKDITLRFLSPDLVEQIVAEALGLLQDPGVRVHNLQALTLLAEAGAAVDFEAQIARIPEIVVRQALAATPSEFDLYTRDGQPVVHYGGNAVQFDPGSAAVTILDAATGEQRLPTTADFVRFVRLVEKLP
jgi:trimethylamine--corrinoid protein Co-methyltransferase